MCKYILMLCFSMLVVFGEAQDCIGYYDTCGYCMVKDSYTQVPEGCKSTLVADNETLTVYFELFQCRDYRVSICSSYNLKPIIQLYDITTEELIYTNTERDTLPIFEFEMHENRKVKAILSLPHQEDDNSLRPMVFRKKIQRYCIGIKVETMVTKR